MTNYHRGDEFTNEIARDSYHMLAGIWGIAEDFKFELTPIQMKLLCRLYESMNRMNIVCLFAILEKSKVDNSNNSFEFKAGKKNLKATITKVSNFIKEMESENK